MPRRSKPFLLDLVEVMVTALLIALFVRTFLFQAFSIPSGSMEPNLMIGDRILVNKFIYSDIGTGWLTRLLPARSVRRGDIVVFRFPLDPDSDFIKRCVGEPGDNVEIERRRLILNSEEIDESGYTYYSDQKIYPRSAVLPEELRHRDNYGPYRLAEDRYFCLGDNRNNSRDSRDWGPVPAENVRGRAWLIYWSTTPRFQPTAESKAQPVEESANKLANEQAGEPTEQADSSASPGELAETAEAEPGSIRWERMLRLVR